MVATPSPDGGREASPALRAADAEAPPTPAVVRAPAPAFRVITVADECQTCSAHPREIRCLPCRHQATCEVCTARHFIAEAGRGHSPPWCPFCRAGVDMVDRAVADQDRAMAEQHAPASARKEDAASSASKVEPETRRVLTFRPDPPSDTAESVGAFLERMQRTPAVREALAAQQSEAVASVVDGVADGVGAYLATSFAALLFIAAVFVMSKLLLLVTPTDNNLDSDRGSNGRFF